MVRGSRLLLTAWLGACKAESLGVVVPKGGVDSINQEDLQRDAWLIHKAGAVGAVRQISMRLDQMHLLPALDDSMVAGGGGPAGQESSTLICAERDGRSGKAVVVLGEPEEPTAAAVVISLAKATDLPSVPRHTLIYCVGTPAAWAAHPAVPADSVDAAFLVSGTDGSPWTIRSETVPGLGEAYRYTAPTAPLDRVNYVAAAEQVKALAKKVAAAAGMPTGS